MIELLTIYCLFILITFYNTNATPIGTRFQFLNSHATEVAMYYNENNTEANHTYNFNNVNENHSVHQIQKRKRPTTHHQGHTVQYLQQYKVGTKLQTVCADKSTIYNKPVVKSYLEDEHYTDLRFQNDIRVWRKNKVFFMRLRQQLFKYGRSEECHVTENDTWRKYIECALRRNQRMEYMIPQYPLHQFLFHDATELHYKFTDDPSKTTRRRN